MQAIAVGLALATQPGLRRRLFGTLLATVGTTMGLIVWSHTAAHGEPFALTVAENALGVLALPLLFVFVSLVARGGERLGSLRRHFALPAIFTFYSLMLVLAGPLSDDPRRWALPIQAIVLWQMAYTAASAWRIMVRPLADRAARGEVRLARQVVGLMFLIHVAQVVRFFSDRPPWRDIVPITATGVVLVLTVATVRGSRILGGPGAEAASTPGERPKYEGSTLSDERAEQGLARLRRALDEERAYLRPDLSLSQLAEEIGMARTHLSQLLNERCGQTFTELIAEHRVSEAERLLADPELEHLTVEAIAERAGFQSRSAFYTAFKRRLGMTPNAFRRRQRRRGGASR